MFFTVGFANRPFSGSRGFPVICSRLMSFPFAESEPSWM